MVSELSKQYRAVVPMVAGIGNALLAVPMVRQLLAEPRKPRVTVIARNDAMAEPFRRIDGIEQVIVTGKSAKAMITQTRVLRPDVYVVPFPSNRWQYNLLAATSGARLRLMHAYPVGRFRTATFLSGATRLPAERGLHDVVQNLRLLKLLGLQPDETETPRFPVTSEDHAAAARIIGETANDFIAVHAGSAKTVLAEAKRWGTQNFAMLIQTLVESGQTVLLLQGPDEVETVQAIELEMSPALRGRVLKVPLGGPLGVAAAVLQRTKLYVGSDSGLAHLAAAVGTRAVTLFSPADPTRVCPSGNRDLVVQPPCACSPCMTYPWTATKPTIRCREPMCVTQISVPMVMDAVHRGLSD